ncbi:MAG: FGGY-family carbohydrate kinase [Lachnospiraceae bacterium]|nr:FGGY-family carbohydrate kinase [Lachnospiraceae bacterium]
MGITTEEVRKQIQEGRTVLGIELGSTRIKAVLTAEDHMPVASGVHDWENRLENGIWTYDLKDVWSGLQDCYRDLVEDVDRRYQVSLEKIGALGISGMMHGYMAFDEREELLVPFRTWRNTVTGQASERLTEVFQYHIPQRWSIAHLYQAVLNGEEHVPFIRYFTTLSGYVHWKLTGQRTLGIGDASGMFPIDIASGDFHERMIGAFDGLVADKGYPWKLREIMPKVQKAGEAAGLLTPEGAKLIDPTGRLQAGIPCCPPEGDAGTGMAATNSVARRTGNVSAGTSIFGMIVLEKELQKVYEEIDLVTTPDGSLVAMAHCNNCTSDLNAWVGIFREFAESMGMKTNTDELFGGLYRKALEGDNDCGGLLAYNYLSGEHVTGFDEGRPLFVRMPLARFNLANFMRVHLFTALGALKTGMDILMKDEGVKVDEILGHGGLFKTKGVGQRILAGALNAPVSVMEHAGEGGAWGMALLASYMLHRMDGESLADFLEQNVFAGQERWREIPHEEDVEGFRLFMEQYTRGLGIERAAVELLRA